MKLKPRVEMEKDGPNKENFVSIFANSNDDVDSICFCIFGFKNKASASSLH